MEREPLPVEQIQTACLLVLTIIAGGAALSWLRPLMVPFVLALMLTYVLRPPMAWLMARLRTPRWLAILLALGAGFLLLTGAGALVGKSVSSLTQNIDVYEAQVTTLVRRAL